ncbi:MAG: glycosyltransferase family 2 protein [Desulfobacterales bacterium]|jgi:glycosyltransferase involved in cell wall biosynthesis|nr:glycosyltransferase family 2 protein [Desulfobacterales bacterium]
MSSPTISVVIPAYKSRQFIADVIAAIGQEVESIVVVDDACPDQTGRYVMDHCKDDRITVLFHEKNLGVGGAVITGYRHALSLEADIIVKIDSDGQMDPGDLPDIVAPIANGYADYSKGNRFYDIEDVKGMPTARLIGNAGLSFLSKLSSGYWSIFDPTNGYTAIHRKALNALPLDKLAKRFFFESDMLFRLNIIRAVVVDVPIKARYGQEKSNLSISREIGKFFVYHLKNFFKRIFYTYYLRDFTVASIQLLIGAFLSLFGVIFGGNAWIKSIQSGQPATAGTVMLAALTVFIGIEFILAFFVYDYQFVPKNPLQHKQGRKKQKN